MAATEGRGWERVECQVRQQVWSKGGWERVWEGKGKGQARKGIVVKGGQCQKGEERKTQGMVSGKGQQDK